jgi:hypothetical protein
VQLIELFTTSAWNTYHAAYISSFVNTPPDVPLGSEAFRQGTGGLDLRKVEEDTPTQATVLIQEHNSDEFARASLEVEPEESHRIVQLHIGRIQRPADFPIAALTDTQVGAQARTRLCGWRMPIHKQGCY